MADLVTSPSASDIEDANELPIPARILDIQVNLAIIVMSSINYLA